MAVPFEHHFPVMTNHHGEAKPVRGIDGEQFVGDTHDRFTHGDHGSDLGQMTYFDPASSVLQLSYGTAFPPINIT